MALTCSKQQALVAFALTAGCFCLGSTHATESLALKVSGKLGKHEISPFVQRDQGKSVTSLLGKVNLFRGVVVDEGAVVQAKSNQYKAGLKVSETLPKPSIKAIYGGLQLSLQENLSLVYTPGRLSSATLNSESQGLYLLTNRGGFANWFVGLESSTYSTAADSRRVTNSAQFGVIVSLN